MSPSALSHVHPSLAGNGQGKMRSQSRSSISPGTPLGELCSTLQESSAEASDALREFLLYYPSARHDLTALSRELADIQMVSRVIGRNGADQNALPADLLAAIQRVVANGVDLVGELQDAIADPERGAQGSSAWLEHTAERIAGVVHPAETARMAMNMALDAFLMASNSVPQPETNGQDLPAYQSSQIQQEIAGLRARLSQDRDSDDLRIHTQRPVIREFIDALQQHVEMTESLLGQPPNLSNLTIDSTSIPESDDPPPLTPAYDAVGITNPAPSRIDLRHVFKKDPAGVEILQVAFVQRQDQLVVALCSTLDSPCKFIGLSGVQVAHLTNNSGLDSVFARNGRHFAYIAEDDMRVMANPYNDRAKKPVLNIADHVTGVKHRQIRGHGNRPLAWSDNSRYFAFAGPKSRVAVIDNAQTGMSAPLEKVSFVINAHFDEVTHAAFTPDNAALVTLSRDRSIRVTDLTTRRSLAKLDLDTVKPPLILGIGAGDGSIVVSVWGDVISHWNWRTGSLESFSLSARRGREGWPLAISPDCRFLVCRNEGGVDISDLHSGKMLYSIKLISGFVTTASFSPDAKYLALVKAGATAGTKVTRSALDVWELIF